MTVSTSETTLQLQPRFMTLPRARCGSGKTKDLENQVRVIESGSHGVCIGTPIISNIEPRPGGALECRNRRPRPRTISRGNQRFSHAVTTTARSDVSQRHFAVIVQLDSVGESDLPSTELSHKDTEPECRPSGGISKATAAKSWIARAYRFGITRHQPRVADAVRVEEMS